VKTFPIISPSRSGHNWIMAMVQSWVWPNVVERYENVYPERFTYHFGQRDHVIGSMMPPVLVVRDYLNWCASYLKYRCNVPAGGPNRFKSINGATLFWLAITREALRHTCHIDPVVVVYYDEFVLNETYRRDICGQLGGSYDESMIDRVPCAGGYSSFDGRKHERSGSEMDVTNRFKWFFTAEGNYYMKFVRDNMEALEFYAANFMLDDQRRELVEIVREHKYIKKRIA